MKSNGVNWMKIGSKWVKWVKKMKLDENRWKDEFNVDKVRWILDEVT